MTFWEFLKDKTMILLLQLICMLAGGFYLSVCKMTSGQLLLFYIAWALLLCAFLAISWYQRSRYFQKLYKLLEGLDKPYLLSEVMPVSWRMEDRLYRDLLRRSNKSVIDAVHHLETERTEYKEFIENWIHEVKLPLTSMNLMCDNRSKTIPWTPQDTRRLKASLSELENDIEKALYYARSDSVYQDYKIHKISLHEVILDVIRHLKPYLIQNHVQIDALSDLQDESVYCDEKWLGFILNQLFINSVKYKKGDSCRIQIQILRKAGQTVLSVEDDGIGIPAEELGRIFEKGFTGSNGRMDSRDHRQSTGIGLYLCKKLSRKLGITLEAESKAGEFTRILLLFPDGSSHFSH